MGSFRRCGRDFGRALVFRTNWSQLFILYGRDSAIVFETVPLIINYYHSELYYMS